MKIYITAYLATGLAFLVIDAIWLSQAASTLYRPIIGELLADKVRIAPAVAFYLLYVLGIVIFAVSPALNSGRWTTALIYGALFGFFAYATYDLTNQATLKTWSTLITVIDLAWGTTVTATSAVSGYLVASWLARSL